MRGIGAVVLASKSQRAHGILSCSSYRTFPGASEPLVLAILQNNNYRNLLLHFEDLGVDGPVECPFPRMLGREKGVPQTTRTRREAR